MRRSRSTTEGPPRPRERDARFAVGRAEHGPAVGLQEGLDQFDGKRIVVDGEQGTVGVGKHLHCTRRSADKDVLAAHRLHEVLGGAEGETPAPLVEYRHDDHGHRRSTTWQLTRIRGRGEGTFCADECPSR